MGAEALQYEPAGGPVTAPRLGSERAGDLFIDFTYNIWPVTKGAPVMAEGSPFDEYSEYARAAVEQEQKRPGINRETRRTTPGTINFREEDTSEIAKNLIVEAHRLQFNTRNGAYMVYSGYSPQSEEDLERYAQRWIDAQVGIEDHFKFGEPEAYKQRWKGIVERVNRAVILLSMMDKNPLRKSLINTKRQVTERVKGQRFWPKELQYPYEPSRSNAWKQNFLARPSDMTPLEFRPSDDLGIIKGLIRRAYEEIYSEKGDMNQLTATQIDRKTPIAFVEANMDRILKVTGLTKLHG
jgi:hypothetical protein